jgi:intracellular septation protein
MSERMSNDHSTKEPGEAGPAIEPGPTGMKLLIELAPLALFFVAYSRFDIYMATGVLMAATVASLVASKILLGKLSLMPLVTGAFVLFFGALTLWFSNETFIKIKPTIVYLCFAAPLLGGLLFRKSLLSHVLGEAITLDAAGWRTLTLRWGVFFIVLAVLNELVWRNFSTSVWVSMKSFGFIPLTILFAVSQAPLMVRHKAQPQVDKKERG